MQYFKDTSIVALRLQLKTTHLSKVYIEIRQLAYQVKYIV